MPTGHRGRGKYGDIVLSPIKGSEAPGSPPVQLAKTERGAVVLGTPHDTQKHRKRRRARGRGYSQRQLGPRYRYVREHKQREHKEHFTSRQPTHQRAQRAASNHCSDERDNEEPRWTMVGCEDC